MKALSPLRAPEYPVWTREPEDERGRFEQTELKADTSGRTGFQPTDSSEAAIQLPPTPYVSSPLNEF